MEALTKNLQRNNGSKVDMEQIKKVSSKQITD